MLKVVEEEEEAAKEWSIISGCGPKTIPDDGADSVSIRSDGDLFRSTQYNAGVS